MNIIMFTICLISFTGKAWFAGKITREHCLIYSQLVVVIHLSRYDT